MMDLAGKKIYNLDLLDGSVGRGQTKNVFDLVTAIAADRPLKNAQEAMGKCVCRHNPASSWTKK